MKFFFCNDGLWNTKEIHCIAYIYVSKYFKELQTWFKSWNIICEWERLKARPNYWQKRWCDRVITNEMAKIMITNFIFKPSFLKLSQILWSLQWPSLRLLIITVPYAGIPNVDFTRKTISHYYVIYIIYYENMSKNIYQSRHRFFCLYHPIWYSRWTN
jgi:hypothetical protein